MAQARQDMFATIGIPEIVVVLVITGLIIFWFSRRR